MKYKRLFFLFIIIIPVLAFRLPEDAPIEQDEIDSAINPLAIYGEYIFHREKCKNCHTLSGPSTNDIVSLDGIAGKYPNSWHFNHFFDPESVKPNSKMPSYWRLNVTKLDSSVFQQILPGHVGNMSLGKTKTLWYNLLQQSDSISNQITMSPVNVNIRTEMIALIAFLQFLPPTEETRRRDSIARAEYQRNETFWTNTIMDSNNVLIRTAKRTDQIAVDSGAKQFNFFCIACHGDSAAGIIGPNLTDDYWLHGGSIQEIALTIGRGIPEMGMKPWRNDFKPEEIGYLIAYIKSLEGSNPSDAKAPQGTKE